MKNIIGVLWTLLLCSFFSLSAQSVKRLRTDTTVVVEDCLRKTIIKTGGSSRTRTEILDCFWESGTDTTITTQGCVITTLITKLGYKKKLTETLPCFWDNAEVESDTVLKPSYNGKWRIVVNSFYKKDGRTKKGWSDDGIFRREAYRAGLDTIERKAYNSSHPVFKQYLFYLKNKDIPFGHRDTTINMDLMLSNINDLRNKGCLCGDDRMLKVMPLKWSKDLEQVAFMYAKEMFVRDFYSHTSPEGKGPGDRLKAYGVQTSCGENIAQGQVNGVDAFKAWIKSPGHCENMMMSRYQYVGVAKYMDRYCMLLGTTIRQENYRRK